MVLKLPLTSAASTNGLQRYRGFAAGCADDGDGGGGMLSVELNVEALGERFGGRALRPIDRLVKVNGSIRLRLSVRAQADIRTRWN